MAKFSIKFNDTPDWAEHGWLGLEDGEVITGFAGSNAAERWLGFRQAEAAIDKEIARARRTSHVSNAEARRIHALLRRG